MKGAVPIVVVAVMSGEMGRAKRRRERNKVEKREGGRECLGQEEGERAESPPPSRLGLVYRPLLSPSLPNTLSLSPLLPCRPPPPPPSSFVYRRRSRRRRKRRGGGGRVFDETDRRGRGAGGGGGGRNGAPEDDRRWGQMWPPLAFVHRVAEQCRVS